MDKARIKEDWFEITEWRMYYRNGELLIFSSYFCIYTLLGLESLTNFSFKRIIAELHYMKV